jgi:transcriptional regulator with XRE-family HTH domain
MDEPLTEELLEELLSEDSAADFLEHHDLSDRSLSDYLSEMLEKHGLERAEVVRLAGIDATYGYQLFKGQRGRPKRDKALALAFAMGLDLRECDRLLEAAGVSRLYCKRRRDAIIMFCLSRKATLAETDECLFQHGEDTIGKP